MTYDPDPPFYNDLGQALAYAFAMLNAGAKDRHSAFHTPTLGTITVNGTPSVRTVVLRNFDAGERILRFHTDLRSRKPEEIAANPNIAFHFYDAGKKLQLRTECAARIEHQSDDAKAAWAASRVMSRACYAQKFAPGEPLAGPEQLTSAGALADEAAFANFCIVKAQIMHLEWLYLAARGHRRAAFDWRGGELRKMWLAP